ncbi:sterol regulatory element binding protein cleavage-activating protein [Sparassis latifolia]
MSARIPSAILRRARAFGTSFFHRFGIHCATHQIRLILVSAVVITALLFPAIAIYTSPETHFFDGFTLRVLDSFLTPDDMSTYFAQHDLRHLWEGHANLRVREDSVARARCGMDGILRAERLLVSGVSQEDGLSALNHDTLLAALELERRISATLTTRHVRCLAEPDGGCFHLSPLAYWNHNEETLLADRDVLDTLNLLHNVSVSGIPIGPELVLTGRALHDSSPMNIDAAMFLALTYFFPDKDCVGNAGHYQWLHVLEEVAGHSGDLVVQAQTPRLVALEYNKESSTRSRLSVLSVFCLTAYFLFFVYCAITMRRMDTVHSRTGLAATGIVEILVSTLTSISVCALVGFRATMVPWELLPLIVIFIGVENMFHIVDAVLKTSVTLPVKERVAQGLSKAGTSNTLKSVSYNAVLGVIAFFSTGAIRQFCAFSIVVLVAHWFLVHTFFVTVLSIDIQRLELDELIRQGTPLMPANVPQQNSSKRPRSPWGKAVAFVQSTLRGRPAKNLSLLLLLAITATLYYATYPSTARDREDVRNSLHHSALAKLRKANLNANADAADRISPAFHIWQILNPADDPRVHIRIESPTILVLAPDNDAQADEATLALDYEKQYRARGTRLSRLWKPVMWLLKCMVFPISTTVLLLYALLLYLLKDAELLEAQRNRPEPDMSPPASDEVPSLEGACAFTTLPRAFPTDVDLVAASTDGGVVAAVGLQNELVVWFVESGTRVTVDVTGLLLGGTSTPSAAMALTAVAVDEAGSVCAVGTGSGVVGMWAVGKDQVRPLPNLTLINNSSSVSALCFGYVPDLVAATASKELAASLYATYENGTVTRWDLESPVGPHYIKPSLPASVVKSLLLPVHADERLLVGFALDDGTLELCDVEGSDRLLSRVCCLAAGNPTDLVMRAHVCALKLDGQRRLVVGAATQAGIVSLWDGGTGECVAILDEPYGDIGNLRITPVRARTCAVCGELPVEGFLTTFSVGNVVLFFRGYVTLPTRHCSCPRNQPQQTLGTSIIGHRSRSGSAVSIVSSTGTTTPTRSRSRVSSLSTAPAPDISMFRVSAHGVHSRRVSEKDPRRNFDTFFVHADCDDCDVHPVGPQDVTPLSSFLASTAPPTIWQNLSISHVADATYERGCWGALDDKIVGVRRRPRPPFKSNGEAHVLGKTMSSRGLPTSALERWELWTFNPAESLLQASTLTVLNRDPPDDPPSPRRYEAALGLDGTHGRVTVPLPKRRKVDAVIPRLHFTRVSPLVSRTSVCLAGFGNTVGVFKFASGSANGHRHSAAKDL